MWVGHEGHEVHLLPTDVAGAEHVRVLPQGPLGPPAPRGPRVEPRGARAGQTWRQTGRFAPLKAAASPSDVRSTWTRARVGVSVIGLGAHALVQIHDAAARD